MRRWIACGWLLAGCGSKTTEEADLLVVVDGRLHLAWSASGDLESIDDDMPGASDYWAAWSPDGNRIARARDDGNEHEIRVLDLTDGDDTVVSTTHAYQLEWSPDGGRIAFRAALPGSFGIDEHELSVVYADGSTEAQLTQTMDVTEWMPRWSPDGRWIAVGVDAGIALFSADGTAGPVHAVPANSFAWSMDSDRLLLWNSDGLQLVEVDSGIVRQVGDANALPEFAWSEAHDRIAFSLRSDDPDGQAACEIFTTGERDTQMRSLARSDLGFCYYPLHWSADGERLLIVRTPFQGPGHEDTQNTPLEIRIVRADASDERVLARCTDAAHPWIEARWRPAPDDNDV